MSNWYRRETSRDIQDIINPDKWKKYKDNFPDKKLPPGYDLIRTEDGGWAVLSPPEKPQMFNEERHAIVRTEKITGNEEFDKQYIIQKALQRIPLTIKDKKEPNPDFHPPFLRNLPYAS